MARLCNNDLPSAWFLPDEEHFGHPINWRRWGDAALTSAAENAANKPDGG
jgi:hypothetical protein